MKIGFFSPYLDTFGGGERYMLELASHLSQSQNNKVDIFWDDNAIKAPLSKFLKIDLSKTNFIQNIFANRTQASKLMSTKKYDLLFVLSDGSVPLSFAKKNILHFQVPFNFSHPDFKTKIKLAKIKYLICNSEFTKNFIDQSFLVKSKVIYPPVDVKSIKPLPKQNLILSVGRFSQNQLHPKKQEVLIEVFRELYKKAPLWKLLLIGQAKREDSKYVRKLRKISQGYAIKIIENLEVEKLRKLYGQASIYWHATGYGEDENKNPERMEHFGISTVEASAAGAIPVVIGKGGQKEIVENGKTGYLWTTKTQLFEKTLELLNSPQLLEKLSKNAIKNSRRFSREKFFSEYEKIIY